MPQEGKKENKKRKELNFKQQPKASPTKVTTEYHFILLKLVGKKGWPHEVMIG